MIAYVTNYFKDLIMHNYEHPKPKIICNPNLCKYTPHIINGSCRFCYGTQLPNIKN